MQHGQPFLGGSHIFRGCQLSRTVSYGHERGQNKPLRFGQKSIFDILLCLDRVLCVLELMAIGPADFYGVSASFSIRYIFFYSRHCQVR